MECTVVGCVRRIRQKCCHSPLSKQKLPLRLNQTPVRLYAAQYVSLETSGRRSAMWPPYSLLRNLSAAAHWHVTVALTVLFTSIVDSPLQWRQNERHNVSNHQSFHWLLNYWFRHRWKKTSKLHVTGLCAEILPVTGNFPTQKACNAENVSIWWRYHAVVTVNRVVTKLGPQAQMFVMVNHVSILLCDYAF